MKYLVDIDPRIKLPEPEKVLDVPTYVTFVGGVTEASAKKFREELEAAESHAARAQQDIIPIVIDSYGGSVYALLSMVDTIQNCSIPVATIVESKAMSAGAVLFTFGAEGHRYIGPNATIMIHDVSSFAFGKEQEIRASSEEAKRLNETIYRMMAENCGHKDKNYFYDKITEKRGADWFMNAEEAESHNLANHVALPEINLKLSMDWSFGLPEDEPKTKKKK